MAALAAGAFAGMLGSVHVSGGRSLLDRAEAPLADIRLVLAGERMPPPGVVVVAIDDETIAAEGHYPLPRERLADLVRAIGAAGASSLAVDILLVDATTAQADTALAEALATVPTVIAAAARFDRRADAASRVPRTIDELWPLAPFGAAASLGFVNLSADEGGMARHVPLVFQTTRGPMPSLVMRAVSLSARTDAVFGTDGVVIGRTNAPLDLGWHLPLRFYGPAKTIETVSAASLLGPAASALRMKGRIAVLGVTATAVGDTFGTPFDPVTPGVEVLATGIANLIDGPALVRDGTVRRIDMTVAVALATGGVLLVSMLPLAQGLGLVVAALLGWLGATLILFAEGYWMSAALPLAAVLPPVGIAAVARQLHERRLTRGLEIAEASLRRFQPPAIATLARDPVFLSVPVQATAAILFVDLAGFTGRSELLGPAGTQDFLKAFHTVVVDVTAAHHGVVMNFMGDGAMVVFGIPETRPDDAALALGTGFALLSSVRHWIARTGAGGDGLDVRVGVHFGPVVLSRLGHEAHQQITVSGDSVNVASRLLEVAKANEASIAASQALLDRAGNMQCRLSAPSDSKTVDIRGRREPVTVALWKIDAGRPELALLQPSH